MFMLLTCRCHSDFQQFLRERLLSSARSEPERLLSFSTQLAGVCLLNLDLAILFFPFLLSRYYASGRPSEFDPVDLLRSLVLITGLKVPGVTQWVSMLRRDKVLAILSGFEPHNTPGVDTFLDFFHR
jgi:hypothetical protein